MNNHSLKILALGRNPEILEVVIRLLNSRPDWRGTPASSPEEALSLCAGESFDFLLLCAGIGADEEKTLAEQLKALPSPPRLLRHYGGGSGLLLSEILSANSKK